MEKFARFALNLQNYVGEEKCSSSNRGAKRNFYFFEEIV